ncbi:hypothetical protein BD289DRAFT_379019 [Coniella lustricola]|uniref:Uncharacterized protein n=1 Tax=Coniella lustricola TaxID=2025994 RepID=A0A2T2ZT99_9PEZI|nr:hypothetical protein BD289DRAFT_379019 [Coniella lustricola]
MQTGGAYSPSTVYAIGLSSVGLGLHALFRPRQEYGRFGLPLEAAHDRPAWPHASSGQLSKEPRQLFSETASQSSQVSPLIYLKGIRELTYGLILLGLQFEGDAAGVTITSGVLALAGLADGLVVWYHGGKENRHKAWGHWLAFASLGSWAGWRAFRAYGERAAFHALHY